MREREAGFTLIELLVTLAVISILAVIALPSFLSQTRKTRASAEVQPMFNDLRVRLEQWLQENGSYPPTIGEGTMHPAGPPSTTKTPLNPLPALWQTIKVRISGEDQVSCRYTWVTGAAGDATNVGPQAVVFGFVVPPTDWYYVLAKCDMDGDGVVFSWYMASSTNQKFAPINEGS